MNSLILFRILLGSKGTMDSKNIYIILLNFNGWQDTLECIQSLNVISEVHYTIIVVDNNSTNDSVMQLRKLLPEKVILLESKENNGFSAGNNIGLKYAMEQGAKYVLLLNNDTLADEDFLSPMFEFVEKTSDCGCISSRIYYNTEHSRIWYDGGNFNYFICRAKHFRFNKLDSSIKGIHETGFISGCCMLIPCEVINKIGLMDERYFLYVEDTEYSLRIRSYGYKLYWDADHHIYHKVSASTKNISKTSQYYEIRNRLMLKNAYLNSSQKITTAFYNIIFYAYKILSKKYDLNSFWRAIKDHRNRRYGK